MGPSPLSGPSLLSNIPYSAPKASNIYGIGSEHPFNNYWTLTGGLAEVISVMPSKIQADILINKFFEAVDPIYPLLYKPHFDAKYEEFWRLSFADRAKVDTSFVAVIMVMLAMGSQFMRLPGDPATAQQNQSSSAEFYASAAHQALRLGAYLNRASVLMLQAMIFMTYFLMNSNHASDAWAFAGIIIRQAYALGLNRDPSLVYDPNQTELDKVERKRVWVSVVAQDAFMSAILRLPPCAIYADIDQASAQTESLGETPSSSDSNASSPEARRPSAAVPESSFDNALDRGYIKAIYVLALLVQQTISAPRSLSLPVAANAGQRSSLIARFKSVRATWAEEFINWTEHSIYELCHRDAAGRRLARQIFFLDSNYWFCITLIHREGCDQLENLPSRDAYQESALIASVEATLQAGHHSLSSFLLMHAVLEEDAGTWWVMAQRAFNVAVSQVSPFFRLRQTRRVSQKANWRPFPTQLNILSAQVSPILSPGRNSF